MDMRASDLNIEPLEDSETATDVRGHESRLMTHASATKEVLEDILRGENGHNGQEAVRRLIYVRLCEAVDRAIKDLLELDDEFNL